MIMIVMEGSSLVAILCLVNSFYEELWHGGGVLFRHPSISRTLLV